MRSSLVIIATLALLGLGLASWIIGAEFTRLWPSPRFSSEPGFVPLLFKLVAVIRSSPTLSYAAVIALVATIFAGIGLLKMGACHLMATPNTDSFEAPRHDL